MKLLVMVIKTDRKVEGDSSKLRGYIGNEFPEYPLLHHHTGDSGYLFTYPRIQYKIIEGTPTIVGIEDGADILKKISDGIKELKIGGKRYNIENIQMNQINAEFGKCRESIQYKFLTPWLPLNPQNYKKYKEIDDWKKRKEFLNNILVGNILSMCKGLDYVVMGKLYAHSLLEKKEVNYKAIPHLGFAGKFRLNFKIPDFMGIGKGVSHGFGTVKRMRKNDRKKT